jgi:hypothetical protein
MNKNECNKKVRYIQPADNEDGFEYIVVSLEEAIKIQKQIAKKANPNFTYIDDVQALDDYLTIHWAEIID